VTDIHYTKRVPSSRTDDYGERILQKCRLVGDIAVAKNVDAILVGGDVFDGKDRVTHNETREMARVLAEWGEHCPVLGVHGNHDASCPAGVSYRPFGTLMAAGLIHNVDAEFEPEGISVGGVVVTGKGHCDDYEKPESYIPHKKFGDSKVVMLTHGMLIFEDRKDIPFEHTLLKDVAKKQTADVVLVAHMHDIQGIHGLGLPTYISPGGLARVSRPEEDRNVSAAVFDVYEDRVEAEIVHIPVDEGGFTPKADDDGFSGGDARDAAGALTLGGGRGLKADVDEAIDAATSKLGHGPEVAAEAKGVVAEVSERS
jgi:DNA repair exonuclease SbcCD nuclease subunit